MDNTSMENIYFQISKRYLPYLMVVCLFFPVVTSAADAQFTNEATGPQSLNQNSLDQSTNVNSNSEQNATTNNNIDLNLDTGNVSVSNNTTVGTIKTGDIEFQTSLTNASNSSFGTSSALNSSDSSSDTTVQATNEQTGPNSLNSNEQTISHNTNIKESNDVSIDNRVNVEANTGDVTAKYNTTLGDVITGEIKGIFKIKNFANVSIAPPEKPEGGVGGDVSLPGPAVGGGPGPALSLPSPAAIPEELAKLVEAVTGPRGGGVPLGRGGGFFPAGSNLLPLMMSLTVIAAMGLFGLWVKPRSS